VDGYNVLHAHRVYAKKARYDLDGARARLVADLAGYAQGGPRTIVVFDGGGNPASDGVPHHLGPLTVIFSPAGKTADTVIEALALRFRRRLESVMVITSDMATRDTVHSGSVSVLSSAEFVEDLKVESQSRLEAGAVGGTRMPVSGRIAPEVSAALGRWARGGVPGGAPRD
jgi:predicted RNA-binding protein with PIN domain